MTDSLFNEQPVWYDPIDNQYLLSSSLTTDAKRFWYLSPAKQDISDDTLRYCETDVCPAYNTAECPTDQQRRYLLFSDEVVSPDPELYEIANTITTES